MFGSIERGKPHELEETLVFLNSCPHFTLKEEEVLIHKDQLNHRMFIILKGNLSIHLTSLDEEPIAILDMGESVGEFSMIDKQPASAFVVAQGPTEVIALDFSQFMQLVAISPAVTVNLLFMLVQRLREGNQKLSKTREQRSHFEEQIYYDGLTSVYNRYWLDNHLPDLLESALENSSAFSLLMLDIDHFKSFNDNYGHAVGDRVLIQVAQTLSEQLRDSDFVARYGGEEFTVLLPYLEEDRALRVAERLRLAISQLELQTDEGEPLPSITASFGLCSRTESDTAEAMIKAADRALYTSKRSGRNRVTVAE